MKIFSTVNARHSIYWVCLGLFIVIVCFTCGRCTNKTVKDGRIIVDTVWRSTKDSSRLEYQPQVTAIQGGQIPDTIYRSVEILRTDRDTDNIIISDTITNALMDYFTSRYYNDTLKMKYGSIYINDVVSQNTIQKRKWSTDFKFPEITKTITTETKKRNEVYFGMLVQGTAFSSFSIAAGPGLLFKNKKDKTFEAAMLFDRKGLRIYQAGIRFKLSFSGQ